MESPIQPILAQTSNYVIQIRPSDDQTFWGGEFSKYFPDGSNTTILQVINGKGAYDSKEITCRPGDRIVGFAYVANNDVKQPMVTANMLNGGKVIQSKTSVGLISDNPIPPFADISWTCP